MRDWVFRQPDIPDLAGKKVAYLGTGKIGGTTITLQPGVAYCLRAFHGLLRDLIQGAWVRFVRRLNTVHLGSITDVSSFLFDRDRSNLQAYRPILRDVQRGQCFYCSQPLKGVGEVDHFIPWARYPTDLGHNFVLAHAGCNNSKSDYLAAVDHLGAWQERNRVHHEELATRFAEAEVISDLMASVRIAKWAYEQTEQAGGQVWVMQDVLKHLGSEWRLVLGCRDGDCHSTQSCTQEQFVGVYA